MTTEALPGQTETSNLQRGVTLYVGRQPIFDERLNVVAYELLYRDCDQNVADFSDGNKATATVLSNTFMEIGAEIVTGGKPAWVNLTRDIVLEQLVHLFPPDRVVAELLEDIRVDDSVVDRVRAMKDAGYQIVLDDFVYSPEKRQLIGLADVVKLDIVALDRAALADHVELLSEASAVLLAEKVETHEDYEYCKSLGFKLFQGYFFSRPQIIAGRKPQDSKVAVLELLAKINDPTSSLDDLEATISRDVGLSYKLLRYINSAAFSLTVKVESIHHALMMLGRRLMQNWVNLVLLTGLLGRSNELLVVALVRARMCDCIARAAGFDKPESYFTAGLFSTLDAIMGQSMADIVAQLPLADDLTEALVGRNGKMGDVLTTVIAYEQANWTQVGVQGLADEQITRAWIEAVSWATTILNME